MEITGAEDLTSGDIYAIVYTADSGAESGNILYHKDAEPLSDQVTGQLADNKLILDDVSRFPETAQTWVIDAVEGGYTVKSCSGTDMYLNLSQPTSFKVPVTNTPETLTISAVEGGFTISGMAEEAPSCLAHGSSGQFYVGAASCTLRIFKKTEVESPVQPEDALAIPGYTRVENAALDEGKYYMIVSQDSAGDLYAFYPDQAYKATDPGNAIDPSHARGCPEGTFVAALAVDTEAGTVSARWATAAQAELEMKDLWFTVEQNGTQWGFVAANGFYLAMQTDMLTEAPAYLAVSADSDGDFTLTSGTKRWLDFNKSGDPNQFKTFATNFWGPSGSKRFPIYLYTKDDATPPPVVSKAALKAAITEAQALDTEIYDENSKAFLETALNAAIEERDRQDSTAETVAAATKALREAMQAMRPKDEFLAPERPNPDHGVTTGEPFPTGIGGSETFRIPALITLNDGSLAAAIDARWDNCPDGFGIDTLFSRSTDGGKTWEYTFPNYFNDSVDQYWGGGKNKGNATAFLDPVMIQGKDGTIYLMTDVYSGGTFILNASTDSGYELIDGVERLAIHYSRDGAAGTYDFYVGDFVKAEGDEKAFAPLIARGDVEKKAAYYVDDHYYLYTADKRPMYCKQLGTNEQPWSGKYVRQNVFYYNADLHVRRATFLWLVTSNDNGKTWSAPTIMNPMVRKRPATHRFYGVGPGAGLCLDDGTILLPCYLHTPERSSFIYKNPGEDTWHRSEDASTDTSSESALVQIDENRVRQFCRDQHNVLRYTDHIRDPKTMIWTAQEPVLVNGVPKTTMNQISALRYSGKINDKPVILVSTAATGTATRENGKIYAFNLENDEGSTMTLIGTYVVNQPGEVYGYSSLTELPDGSISLLYEDTWTHATYKNILLNEIIPSAIVDGKRTVVVPLYQSVEDTFEFETLPTEDELAQMDGAIAAAKVVDGKVLYTGNKLGETSYVVDGVTVIVRVTDPEDVQDVALEVGESRDIEVAQGEIQRNTDPGVVDAVITTVDKSITVTGGQGHTGTDAAYDGELEPLAKGLHMFVADDDGFQVFGRNEASQRVWLNAAGTNGYPFSKQPVTTYFEQQDDSTFFITTEGRYLAFWRNGSNIFDAGSSASGDLYKFKLYRPAADGEASSEELPGYVRIQQAAEIKDGGFYLIAAEYHGDHYILWPSIDSSSKYAHIVKADKAAESVTYKLENQFYTLTLTGKSAGTADVVVNDSIYRVSVVGGESSVTTYPITVEQSDNGTVTASRAHASRGLTITLTVKSDEGYKLGALTVVDKNGSEVKLADKGDGKYSFTMPASAVAVRAEFVAESSALPFNDVSVNDWFYSAVKYVYGNELMNGTSSNTFAPLMTTDRAMIVTILWRLEGSPVVKYAVDFGDVENGGWYTEAVRWAASEGIVTGYSDAVFAPSDTVTREQLAVILYRHAESQGYDVSGKGDLTAFSDGRKTSPWAVKAMEWAVGAKLLSGKGGDVLDPTGTATRAEVAQVYMNFAQNLKK
ncbi:MAG: S-layer homology domain-containing protein [Clostridiales bacterium]|nr:S-layer homology domain-containing protein [Clostridiales bacterium]